MVHIMDLQNQSVFKKQLYRNMNHSRPGIDERILFIYSRALDVEIDYVFCLAFCLASQKHWPFLV